MTRRRIETVRCPPELVPLRPAPPGDLEWARTGGDFLRDVFDFAAIFRCPTPSVYHSGTGTTQVRVEKAAGTQPMLVWNLADRDFATQIRQAGSSYSRRGVWEDLRSFWPSNIRGRGRSSQFRASTDPRHSRRVVSLGNERFLLEDEESARAQYEALVEARERAFAAANADENHDRSDIFPDVWLSWPRSDELRRERRARAR